jgi:hypothetical protein
MRGVGRLAFYVSALAASSFVDVLIAAALAVTGIAVAPLPRIAVVGTLVAAVVFAFAIDS